MSDSSISAIDTDFVLNTCQIALSNYNIKSAFPKNVPIHLTYQWRAIVSITNKFVEWNFTPKECALYIETAIQLLATNKSQKIKGINILNDPTVIDRCYDKVKKELSNNNQTIDVIKNIHSWLYRQAKNQNIVEHLIFRRKPTTLTNITTYFESNNLTKTYIAYSKPCCIALGILSKKCPQERMICPTDTALFYTRRYSNKSLLPLIRETLGSDFHV